MAVRRTPERTERADRVEQRPYPLTSFPGATNVNVGGTAAASVSPVWTVTRVVTLVFTILEALLLIRFILKLLGANPNQPIIDGLYRLTDGLVAPFQGIFPQPVGPPVLDVPALLAIVFLFLVAALIVALVRAIAGRTVSV